jgi:exosortase D (VPLPA-CTERM-specific)
MSQVQLRSAVPGYALLALAVLAAALLFSQAIQQLYSVWNLQPEYSYGILIPILSVFLVWRDRHSLRGLPLTGSWKGLPLIAAGLALRVIGQFGTMPALVHYALLLVLYGLVLSLTGPALFRRLLMPLLILVFMVPLPPIFSEQLSLELQLLSSQIGVWFIRTVGISVFLEGNIIDLGSYQLEVAAACSGLRYLFPLMTLAFLVAYALRGPFWRRAVLFLSSIPITVLMNSLRIGIIGITVDRWGTRMAEGVLHDFEGWAVFMLSCFALALVYWTLAMGGGTKAAHAAQPYRAAAVDAPPNNAPAPAPPQAPLRPLLQAIPRSFVVATALVAVGAGIEIMTPERPEVAPARIEFADFPLHLNEWVGQRSALEPAILDALRLDDYILADYQGSDGTPVNLYVAFYQSQRSGMSVHSPRRCIPGGGWKITSFERHMVSSDASRVSWPVNRVLIEHGNQKALVYYWFRERGRRLTNEYVVRWYLFWDSLVHNRTDGALVRLVIPVTEGANLAKLDTRLAEFAYATEAPLSRAVPD